MNSKIWTAGFIAGIIIFTVALALQVQAYYFPEHLPGGFAYGSLTIANLWAINYLYRYGSFARSRYRNAVYLFTSAFFIATLLRIQHWPGSNLILLVTWGSIAAAYTLWFSMKENKGLTDVLKLIWVVAFCCVALLRSLNLVQIGIVGIMLPAALLFYLYIRFHIERVKKPAPMAEEWDFNKDLPD